MIDYGKIITTESVQDSKVLSTKKEYEQSIFSTKDTFLKDVIESMKVITSGLTNKVCLEIKIDERDRVKIKKRWEL